MSEKWEAFELIKALHDIHEWLTRHFTHDLPTQLNRTEIRTLIEIRQNPRQPMKYYLRSAGIETGSFTYLANKLEKKNLIIRLPSEQDRRITILDLTDEGRQLTAKVHEQFLAHLDRQLSCLSEAEVDELKEITVALENITKKLETH